MSLPSISRFLPSVCGLLFSLITAPALAGGGKALRLWNAAPRQIHVTAEWRPRPESNRGARICSPLRNHSATRPSRRAVTGAGATP